MSDQYSDEEFEQALSDPMAWEIANNLTSVKVSPPALLRHRIESVEVAADNARALIEPIVVSPSAFREADVEHRAMYRTPEAVRLLCSASRMVRDTQPQFALILASAATDIAAKLQTAEFEQAILEGIAWLQRGIACGTLGKYHDGDIALARAEAAYGRVEYPTRTWDLANVWLSQANIRVETERLDEAVQLAHSAAEGYFEFGDLNHGLRALLVRAVVFYYRHDFAAGIQAYEEVLGCLGAGTGEVETRARAVTNLAICYLESGEYAKAQALFGDAAALWDELGSDIERARAAWGLAAVEVARGGFDDGIRQLQEALRQFEALGVVNDATLTRLQLAESLLAAGRASEVPSVLYGVAVSFASEGMMRNARMALAYLHEAMAAGTLTVPGLRYVRVFIEHLPTRPASHFEPPAKIFSA